MVKKIIPRHGFHSDKVACDVHGRFFDFSTSGTGVEDIKSRTLRLDTPDALLLREKPAAVLHAMLRMAQGFTPDQKLLQALFEWQPPEQMNMPYLKDVVLEHLEQLYPAERMSYVHLCHDFHILHKMFGVDYSTLNAEEALRELKALVTKAKPGYSPFLFTPVPQSSEQNASAEMSGIKPKRQ